MSARRSGTRSVGTGIALRRWWTYQWRHHRAAVVVCIVLLALITAVVGAGLWFAQWAVAPDLPPVSPGPVVDGPEDQKPADPEKPKGQFDDLPVTDVAEELPDYIANQREGVYTFLLIGRTNMDDNADMLMLAVFDSNTGEVNAVSIPRDTMVNINRDVKKINATIFAGVGNVKSWVRKTLGIQPNFYVMLDWQAVGDMVDAVGGVYFNVPFRMHYIDTTPGKAFTIDLEEGYQLLNGDQAMQFIRWRQNNVDGTYRLYDEGRMKLQQQFIATVAYQILKPQNALKLGTFAKVFTDNVETDLTMGNLVWFAQQALKLDSANKIQFHKLPGNYAAGSYSRTLKNIQSYVTLYPNQLLELVNTYLNPYESRITLGNLDLMSINGDGTISSSTGTVADEEHNPAALLYRALRSGEAYYNEAGELVYAGQEENPDGEENPDSSTSSPGGEENPGGDSNPGGEENPGGDSNPGGEENPGGDSNPGGEENPGGDSNPGGEENPGGDSNPGGEENPGGDSNPGGEENPGGDSNPGGEENPDSSAANPNNAEELVGEATPPTSVPEDPGSDSGLVIQGGETPPAQ